MNRDKRISFFKVEAYLNDLLEGAELQAFEKEIQENEVLRNKIGELKGLKYEKSFSELFPQYSRGDHTHNFLRDRWVKVQHLLLRPSVQVVFSFCLLVAIGLSLRLHSVSGVNDNVFTAKGNTAVKLQINSFDLNTTQVGLVKPGDTLCFVYRSNQKLYFQVWYQDDNLAPEPYIHMDGNAVELAAATKWINVEYSVVLGPGWQNETVWILTANTMFTLKDKKEFLQIIQKEKPLDSFQVKRYVLKNKDVQ